MSENVDQLRETEMAELGKQAKTTRGWWSLWRRIAWPKVGIFIVSLFLFILAITLMKEGARDLGPLVRDRFNVTNAANSLGFGWLFAYVVMSGSPVAAASLAFFDAGIVDQLGAFTMISGSRLGASFIVLFIGFIYVLRGRNRANSLGMGLLSLSVTITTFVAALGVGMLLLASGAFNGFQPGGGAALASVTDRIFDPITIALQAFLPNWGLFIVGFGVIMVSFSLFDRCLPEMSIKESQVGRVSRLVYRPWVMFLLGALITLVSMSVSVSLSILVPLSQRGFVRRENVIPYIMGANITTFIDTLMAALLLNNPPAFTVVWVQMLSIAIVSAVILLFFYRWYERSLLALVEMVSSRNRNFAIYMGLILIVPIILMLL